jgi:hypothetical protein
MIGMRTIESAELIVKYKLEFDSEKDCCFLVGTQSD